MDEKKVRSTISEIFEEMANALETGSSGQKVRVGITILGSEHGPRELLKGAADAQQKNSDLQVVILGPKLSTSLETVEARDEKAAQALMDQMLSAGTLDAAVTMHYSFPIGVSTVGRVITPGQGKEMFIATTTGTSATERVSAMLKNTLYGLAAAKACGKAKPSVGLLNIEGARQVERALKKLQANGYPLHFAQSARSDGGAVMRGNDLLLGVPDVMVTDSLTGNVLMKMFSAYTSGGNYEALGYGYGPGLGESYDRLICILSRASGAPVVAGAIRYAAEAARGKLLEQAATEFALARKAGWDSLMSSLECPATAPKQAEAGGQVAPPPEKPVTAEIPGIEILQLEEAVQVLWQHNIYAASGMGCTGPIVMVAPEDREGALELLRDAGYL